MEVELKVDAEGHLFVAAEERSKQNARLSYTATFVHSLHLHWNEKSAVNHASFFISKFPHV